jgi:hypothetical protein
LVWDQCSEEQRWMRVDVSFDHLLRLVFQPIDLETGDLRRAQIAVVGLARLVRRRQTAPLA